MSTQPIVIQITDQIDSNIIAKINGIEVASTNAARSVTSLNAALQNTSVTTSTLRSQIGNLASAVTSLTPPVNAAAQASSGLENGFARLLARVVGVELGMGRLGGAFGNVGIAAAGAGPLIVAALAVAAVAGAVLVYRELEKEALALMEAELKLAESHNRSNDRLLQLKESYIGLTEGPLAKYVAMLGDQRFKSISVDMSGINELIKAQTHWWSEAFVEIKRYGDYYNQIIHDALGMSDAPAKLAKTFDTADADKFIKHSELVRNAATDTHKALLDDMNDVGKQLNIINALEKTLTGDDLAPLLAATENGRLVVQAYWNKLLDNKKEYIAKDKVLTAEANGATVSAMLAAVRQEKKIFDDELTDARASGLAVTADQERALVATQLEAASHEHSNIPAVSEALTQNVNALKKEYNSFTDEIIRHNANFDKMLEKYHASTVAVGALTEATKIQAQVEKLTAQAGNDPKFPLTSDQTSRIQSSATANVQLEDDQKKAKAMQDYNASLAEQTRLLGSYGQALRVTTEIENLRKTLRKDFRDLNEQEIETERKKLTQLNTDKQVSAEANKIYAQTIGLTEELTIKQQGITKAYNDQVITLGQYKTLSLQVSLQQNQLNNELTGGTLASNIKQIWGGLLTDFQSLQSVGKQVIQNLDKDFTQFFSTLEKGLGNAVAQTLVFGKSFKTGLVDTARQAVASLISSLVELGIQYLIVEALGLTLPKPPDAKQTAQSTITSIAAIALVTGAQLAAIEVLQGPAWDLAEAVSLFSFGANAALATAGMAAVISVGTAAQGKAWGGFITGPGTKNSDSIPTWLSNGEFVINADATAKNRQLLEAINSGATSVSNNGASVNGGTSLAVHVIHDGSTAIVVQQIDEHTVRVIAKQEAKQAVHTHAPDVISADIHNPNSKTSKALSRNLDTGRKR
jgi:hypothetical protein